MKKSVETKNAPPPATTPISQAIKSGDLVFTSGQIHLTPEGELVKGTTQEKAHQVMKNLRAILKAAGVSFQDVVKSTVYVTDMEEYGDFNEVYKTYFEEPFPARERSCA